MKVTKYFLFLITMFFGFTYSAIAGERILLKSPVLYYECIACTDVPNISHPSYAAIFKPVINDWNNFKDKKTILRLLRISEYENKMISLNKTEDYFAPEARLMLIGLLDYAVMLDRYGYVKIGLDVYKLEKGSRAKLDSILGGFR
ncbi:hypothetical protein [Colwellia sp. 12G3]|uniref:hypothetical protein n=1 Tax=Colwellia sp. 12G3 TaxID=2058299 RepID=UPI000C349BD2|nr:hypothetical protein [Colwellia sp. 12G3]PKI16304.1 hypothetical protein CXF71_09985 [Colwellia sp. 12G3]